MGFFCIRAFNFCDGKFLYSCPSCLIICFDCMPFCAFCYMFGLFYSEKDYNTMLTAVPLFLTFLPIMSVCFVHTSLSYIMEIPATLIQLGDSSENACTKSEI